MFPLNMKRGYIRLKDRKKSKLKSSSTVIDKSRPLINRGTGSSNTPTENKDYTSELKKEIIKKNMKEYNFWGNHTVLNFSCWNRL